MKINLIQFDICAKKTLFYETITKLIYAEKRTDHIGWRSPILFAGTLYRTIQKSIILDED